MPRGEKELRGLGAAAVPRDGGTSPGAGAVPGPRRAGRRGDAAARPGQRPGVARFRRSCGHGCLPIPRVTTPIHRRRTNCSCATCEANNAVMRLTLA